jgi:PAS domain S-box-containing protein
MPPSGEPRYTTPRSLIIAIVILFIAIVAAGVLFYQSQEQQVKDQVTSDLTAIAKLKADNIVVWRADRLFDARVISAGAFFTEGSDHFLTYGDNESREKILIRFQEMNASPHYYNALLVDPQGIVHISLDPDVTSIPPSIIAQVNASLMSGDPILTDIYEIPGTHSLRLDVIAPLTAKIDGSEKPVAAVLLSINPDDFLYPLIQSWPVPSGSAETLLVEREGDHVLFLNELRHQSNTAFNLTIPVSQTNVPAVMAVMGKTGVFSGKDYRGVDVISVLEPIPGSPWFMVTKVDEEEAYYSWRSRAILIIVLITGTLTGAVILIGLIWQHRKKYYYQSLYAAETERRGVEQRNRERLGTLLRLTEMESASEQDLADFVLDAGCRLTNSTFAFFGVMSSDETIFDITAWSKSAMKDCSLAISPIHFPIKKAGIWAEAVRKREPIIINDYSAPQPGKKGLPPGHVSITRFVSVPIFEGHRIVMVCAVANKETGYTDIDVDNLTLLMQGVWNHLQKRAADAALRQKKTDLEAAYEKISARDEELGANYEELTRNQRALAESERKCRNLYQYAQVGLFETNLKDATVVTCNERYRELAGFPSVEAAIGKDILRIYVNPEDRETVKRILIDEGVLIDHLVRFRNLQTGKEFWGQLSARIDRKRDIAEGTIIDVTAQKEAETEIQNSKNFLNSIIEQSPNPIWISDEKGTLLRLNKACCAMLHITPEEVVGRYNIFEDSIVEAQGMMPLVRSVFEEGKSVNFDLEYDSKLLTSLVLDQSAKVFLNVTIFPVRDTTGRITNAVIQHLDFTKRKRAEAELAAAHQQYRELFENVSIGILRSTPGPQGTLIEANPAALRIFEADSREQFFLVHPSDLYFDPDQRSRVSDEILAKGAIKGMEVRYKTLKGKPIWGRITSIKKVSEDGQIYFDNTLEDITERKRMEAVLRQSEQKFSKAFHSSPDVLILSRQQDGLIIDVNDSWEQVFGYSRDDAIGKTSQALGVFENPNQRQQAISLLQAEGSVRDFEIEIRRKSGEIRKATMSVEPIELDMESCMLTILRDITERKRVEEALRESEKKFRDTILNLDEGFYSCTMEGVLIEHNPAFNRILGFEPDIDMRGVLLPDFWQDTADRQEYVNELTSRGIVRNYIINAKKPGNEKIVVSANSHVVYDQKGSPVRIEGTFLDITEQKRAEEQIKSSETRYRRLFESARDGILIINQDTGRIIDANPFIETLLGYSPQEIIGKYLWDIGPFTDRLLSKIAFEELQEKKYIRYEDLPLETKHGRMIDAEFVSIVYPIENTSVIQYNIRDITDRKTMERQREALIKDLEQKNTELERYTYTVSHDLKSPLITIRGFAGLLEDDALKGDPLQLKKDIHRIVEAADTMQALLADLLELSRIGRIVNPPEKTPFGKIVHEAVELLEGPLTRRGVTVEIAPYLPDVNVDHARIREVMVNLIENALKFLGDQPDPIIRIGMDMKDETPVFFVQDNGIGIDPRYLERIFNLFERLDTSAAGTGIGLTIVRRIIEMHGGRIWAESEGPGKGTTFRFTLTAVQEGME